MGKKVEFIPANVGNGAGDGELEAIELGDRDSEHAWDKWIDGLRESESTGTIRAHKVPSDESGNPSNQKGTRQTFLGSWAHQLYDFDALCAKICNEFLEPGERAHIKFTGQNPGQRGVMFSRIVTMQRPKNAAEKPGGESVTELIRVLQESQAAQMRMAQQSTPQPTAPSGINWTGVKEVAAIAVPAITGIVTALITRPKAPPSDIAGIISAMGELRSFITGEPKEDSADDSVVGILKSMAPLATEVVKVIGTRPGIAAPPPAAPPPMLSAPAGWPHPAKQTPPQVQVTPQPQPQPRPQQTPMTLSEGEKQMLHVLKPQLDELAKAAAEGADPAELAKLVVSMVPEQFQDTLSDFVENPVKWKLLESLSGPMKAHSAWFEQLRQAMEPLLFEDDGAAPTDGSG